MTAIEFENISKQYHLGLVSTGTLSHDLNRFWQTKVLRRDDPYLKVGETNDRTHKGHSDYVWALKDINFKVEQGDVVGIIGRNGAGKSTLLKLLSRVTAPTTGTIRAQGRIASLLEVGTGFHPEMTGRENIYMNGAIMGMTRAEITRKLDDIVDFSGCERYLDTPVKRYSSGMTVRLGFAIAAHLEPEILVVDEVLAVGDAEFQKKAIGKMQDVSRGGGRTVLFVSHNMGAVKSLCQKGILLENGRLKDYGDADTIVSNYIRGDNSSPSHKVWNENIEYSKDGFKLLEIGVKRKGGKYGESMPMDDDIELIIRYKLTKDFEKMWLTMHYKNEFGATIFSSYAGAQVCSKKNKGEYLQTCTIPKNTLNWGNFSITLLAFHDNAENLCNAQDVVCFSVAAQRIKIGDWMGGREPGDVTPKFSFFEEKIKE